QCSIAENGIEHVLELVGWPLPEVYSAELSLFAMEAGIRLLERERPDLLYLSLTDYIQHKHAPGAPAANAFYAGLDAAFGRLHELGALVALIADHGMNDKSKPDGSPNAIFLQDLLDREFGARATRVVLTITDPYVVHHGALGGFVGVYCDHGVAPESVIAFAKDIPGIEAAMDRDAACAAFALPADRQPDVAVISDAASVIGAAEAGHDLSALKDVRLRSHGGIAERWVPMILSRPLNDTYAAKAAGGDLKSYQVFDFAINGTL
ncbi:MAG: alkaline phosphatase family protein, partial [Kiloniellales bacterium]